jgi:hypothetical protein
MYHQLAAALLLPQNLGVVLRRWKTISHLLAEPPRKRRRYIFA